MKSLHHNLTIIVNLLITFDNFNLQKGRYAKVDLSPGFSFTFTNFVSYPFLLKLLNVLLILIFCTMT